MNTFALFASYNEWIYMKTKKNSKGLNHKTYHIHIYI